MLERSGSGPVEPTARSASAAAAPGGEMAGRRKRRLWVPIAVGALLVAASAGVVMTFFGGTFVDVVAWQRGSFARRLDAVGITARTLDLGDDRVRVWSGGGPGRPVVLVHGFGASSEWQWTPQAVDLAADRRVVMPDLLWFGGSSSTRADYSLDHQVAAVVAALDALDVGEADLVGISYGGMVAFELAAAYPGRVRRLVLVDSPGRLFTDEDYEALLARFGTDDFARVLLPEDDEDVRTLIELAYERPPPTPGWAARQARVGLYSRNREELAALVHELLAERQSLRARTTPVLGPVLVVWGASDPVFPLPIGERLSRELGAPLEVIPSARHFPNAEHPERFNRILRDFLDGP